MAPKITAFLAILTTMCLLFSVNVHGCEPSCSSSSRPLPPAMPTPTGAATCPINTLDLNVCVNLLNGLLTTALNTVTTPSQQDCCSLLDGLADVEAALCVCTTIELLNLNVPVNVNVLLNKCGKTCPQGFTCPAY